MKIALRELVRKPGQFLVVGGALTLLTLLLLFLGSLLDGLFLGSTGAIRTNDADGLVFSDDARQSFLRSSVNDETRAQIESVPGAGDVGGLGISLLGLDVDGLDESLDGAIAGYELSSDELPDPPPAGQAWADRRLNDLGVDLDDVLLVGPAQIPLTVAGWVDDTNYLLQNGVWVEPGTWREIQNANRPDAPVADDEFQAFVVRLDPTTSVAVPDLLRAIDRTTGSTETLSQNDAVFAVPGITEQNQTFTSVIGVTIAVAGLVVALFFALLTVERQGLYAVLKAFGGSSRLLVSGVIAQAVVIALVAFAIGALLTFALAQVLPPEVPAEFQSGRIVFTLLAVTVAAVIGGLVSLRRITKIDPAAAISAGV